MTSREKYQKEYGKKYREKNLKKEKERKAVWYEENHERTKAHMREYDRASRLKGLKRKPRYQKGDIFREKDDCGCRFRILAVSGKHRWYIVEGAYSGPILPGEEKDAAFKWNMGNCERLTCRGKLDRTNYGEWNAKNCTHYKNCGLQEKGKCGINCIHYED